MLPLWNWRFKQNNLYLLPYPYIIIAIIIKSFFSHDEEKIVAFCLIIFAIILYYSVNISLIQLFEERSASIAAAYREVIQVRRGILPKMRRFMRLFMDLEDAIARTGICLFFDLTNLVKKININRSKFILHFVKNQVDLLLIKTNKIIFLFNKFKTDKNIFLSKNILLKKINKKKIIKLFFFTNLVNNLNYLLINKLQQNF